MFWIILGLVAAAIAADEIYSHRHHWPTLFDRARDRGSCSADTHTNNERAHE
jgi:hypothetical protein